MGEACSAARAPPLTDPDFSQGAWMMRDEVLTTAMLRRVGLVVVFLWFAVGGFFHFYALDAEMHIVPPYIPWPRAAVLISGVFELLGAVGILVPATRRAAGVGLFLLTIAVTPANVYMLQHAELFRVPHWALVVRLPFQVALLALIIWSTRSPAPKPLARVDS
jgi:uncharacterized membrane protein